jgi:hypothetical protein
MKLIIKMLTISLIVMSSIVLAGCGSTSSTSTLSNTTTVITATETEDFNGVNSGSAKSANGLNLTLALDAKTYRQYQDVSIAVDEKNTLSKTNRISAADKWPLPGLTLGQCSQGSPFGIAIFQGDYNSKNISTITPLVIFDPDSTYHCPAFAWAGGTVFDFAPQSDLADVYYGCQPPCDNHSNIRIYQELSLTHYWTGSRPATIHSFEPGVYTIVAGDEWGNLVILHFTVTEPTITSTVIQPQEPVAVQSVAEIHLSGQPINPAGPQIAVFLQNNADQPIVSLSVMLTELGNRSFDFDFGITNTDPFLPGKTKSAVRYLVGGGFGGGIPYSLKISGTFQDGSAFSETWNSPAN